MRPHRWQPTRLPHPWDSPGKNTGMDCHFLLQCMKVKVKSLSRVKVLVIPWTVAYQASPSMGFSRQEYWSGVQLTSPNIYLLSVWILAVLPSIKMQPHEKRMIQPVEHMMLPQTYLKDLQLHTWHNICYYPLLNKKHQWVMRSQYHFPIFSTVNHKESGDVKHSWWTLLVTDRRKIAGLRLPQHEHAV